MPTLSLALRNRNESAVNLFRIFLPPNRQNPAAALNNIPPNECLQGRSMPTEAAPQPTKSPWQRDSLRLRPHIAAKSEPINAMRLSHAPKPNSREGFATLHHCNWTPAGHFLRCRWYAKARPTPPAVVSAMRSPSTPKSTPLYRRCSGKLKFNTQAMHTYARDGFKRLRFSSIPRV